MVTVTSTRPKLKGDTAVIRVARGPLKLLAASVPNLTAVAPTRLLPLMVTVVPPLVEPLPGLIEATTGCRAVYVN